MREYQTKKKIKRRIFSKISIGFLAIMLFFLIKATYNVYQKNVESQANLARVNSSLEETEQRYESLKKENERLGTNEGVEEEIRHKFQVSKEGEKVIVVIDDESQKATTSPPTTFWARLKYDILTFIKK